MKLKIVSDGNPYNTRIINAETGETLDMVTRLTWEITPDMLARCTMELVNVAVDLECETEEPDELILMQRGTVQKEIHPAFLLAFLRNGWTRVPEMRTATSTATQSSERVLRDFVARWPSEGPAERTFRERWIEPLLHPATVPFEPWRRDRAE